MRYFALNIARYTCNHVECHCILSDNILKLILKLTLTAAACKFALCEDQNRYDLLTDQNEASYYSLTSRQRHVNRTRRTDDRRGLFGNSTLTENGDLNSLEPLSDFKAWLRDKVSSSKNILGISTFLLAGSSLTMDISVAGKAVLAEAWDKKQKKVVKKTPKNVNSKTSFMIASVSKTVVWTALSMVYDAGLFKIDDSIDKVMPFKVRNPGHKSVPLTYRMLYAHTNGIKDEYGGYLFDTKCPANKPYTKSLATVILRHTKKKSNWYKFKPGETHKYTNYGTALAALLVERHTGMEFTYFVQNYIFNPLAMKSSKFYRPRDGSASEQYSFNGGKNTYHTWSGGYCFPDYPSGQLWTTSADLAKFSRVMLNHGRLSSSPTRCLYSAKTGTQVFKKTAPGKGDGDSAMGWFVGKPYYPGGAGHDGSEGGVTTELFLHLDSPRIAIGWLANGELSYKEGKQMTQKMMAVAKSMGSGPAPPNDSCIKIWKGRNESCQDSEIFKFKKDKSCAWVASSLGRITKFCNKKVKDKLIKEWCPLACTNCLVE